MSKRMSGPELIKHCEEAINDLKETLSQFSKSASETVTKRAMLIAYWLKTYTAYIRTEDAFSPQSVFRLKRGSVIRVEFGYRVGKELGGRHYAVVLDADNSIYRNTVTVIPLGSLKEQTKQDKYNITLKDGIYKPVKEKVEALINDAERTLDEASQMDEKINAVSVEEKSVLKAVQRQKIETAQKLIEQATAWVKEVSHMKLGSVAKVDQVTTISKMRISQPLQKTHPLYGIRLTPDDMDKIDEQLVGLYFQKKA